MRNSGPDVQCAIILDDLGVPTRDQTVMRIRTTLVGLAVGAIAVRSATATSYPYTPIPERVDTSQIIVVGRAFDVYRTRESDYGTLAVDSILVWDRSRWKHAPWVSSARVALQGWGIGLCDSCRAVWFLTDISGHSATLRLGYWPLALEDADMMPMARRELRNFVARHPSPAHRRVLRFVEQSMHALPPSRWYLRR